MEEGGTNSVEPARSQPDWRTASELLKASQYQQLAEILHQAQVTSQATGDPVLAHVLAAACRVCQACAECRAEAERHQQASEASNQRERELRNRLHAILDLIRERETPTARAGQAYLPHIPTSWAEPAWRGPPEPPERPSLWRWFQALLGHKPVPAPRKRASPVPLPERMIAPSYGKERERKKQGKHVPPSIAVYCLGPFRVYQDDQLITNWESLKARSVFKYLVMHRATPTLKDVLMDLFWPDADPEAARRNLHQAIYSLRQTLRRGHPEFQHVQFENDCYFFNPELDVWTDVEEFETHIQAGQRLEAARQTARAMAEYGIAEGLYQGDLLAEDLYEDWPSLQREYVGGTYLDIANRLSEYYVQRNEYTAAIALCQKILDQDNCCEETHHRLMRCYLAQGQRHLAVRQYQACAQALEELALVPAKETVTLYRQITSR